MSTETVRLHEFANGVCLYCGGRDSSRSDEMSCVPRQRESAPRQLPPSFDARPWEIGERMKEIRAEEEKSLAGTPEPELPDMA